MSAKDMVAVHGSPSEGEAISLASDSSGDWYCLYVGTGGDVKVNMAVSGTALTFSNVPDGQWLPVHVTQIYSTANGTTASNILAFAR